MQSTDRPIPSPAANPETQAYWDAANRDELLIKRCAACGQPHHYPRAYCPFCFGETRWEKASGRGAIYSFSVMRRAPVPFAIAYVALAEGPIIMSNIVECDLDALRIGQQVEVCFKASENGTKVPVFRPAAD